MFSGFGSAENTNKRWHQLLKDGETGLSTAFDFPTLESREEKGKGGKERKREREEKKTDKKGDRHLFD